MVGAIKDFETEQRQKAARATDLTDFDQMIIGGWVRLEVPFHSVAALKQWRDLMGGLLATIDFYLQPRAPGAPYLEERSRLLHIRGEAQRINRITRGYKGPGRPKKKVNASGGE